MPTGASEAAGAPARSRGPRRLTRAARREQLVAAALPIVAARGLSGFSLDEVAAGADVTRNLIYHYFPRGRDDIILAVAAEAGRRLTGDWNTDESVPLPDRIAANVGRIIEHAAAPSDSWLIYRLAHASSDPGLHAAVERFEDAVIESIALNRLGTTDPPPLVRIAIRGYLAFFATTLDEARARSIPPTTLLPLVNETLAAALHAAAEGDRPAQGASSPTDP